MDTWRSRDKGIARRSAGVLLVILCGMLHAACSHSPTSPTPPSLFLGVWKGPMTSALLGTGTLTLDVTFEIGPAPITQFQGRWTMAFPDPRFGGEGTFSGGLAGTASEVILQLSPALLPCPGEPDGVRSEPISGWFAFADDRITGTYESTRCPNGTVVLTRQ